MKKIFLLSLLSAGLAHAVQAAILAEDSFDYAIGSPSSSWVGGSGFNSRWSMGSGTRLKSAVVKGLSFGSMSVSGNALHCSYEQNDSSLGGDNVWRHSGFSVNSGNLWVSYLYQFDAAAAVNPDKVIQTMRLGLLLRGGINEGNSAFFVQYKQAATKAVSPANNVFKDGTTLLLVFAYYDLGKAAGSTAKGWALTVSGYEKLINAGITEENLNTCALLSVGSSSGAGAITLAENTQFAVALNARGKGSVMACTIDEIKIGSSVADVIGGATPRPKPPVRDEAGTIRPLAPSHVVIGESPDPKRIPVYTPSILALPSGRLVASYILGSKRMTEEELKTPPTVIVTSDDHGKTWQVRHRTDIPSSARLFSAGGKIYLMGHKGDLRIVSSADKGNTWGETVNLTKGQNWHQAASNVWKTRGNIYLVMERHVSNEVIGWGVGQLAPVLMRAKESDDLTKFESWTFSNQDMAMMDAIPGYRENKLPFDYFGVPFYRQSFPNDSYVTLTAEEQAAYEASGEKPPRKDRLRHFAPMGWLESNVVQITDPNHYWHDPSGRTFHIFMRAHTGGTGYAALMKAVEKDDGGIEVGFEHAPSGKIALFLPFPGGQMRFHVLYDEKTKLYWLLCTQATDSMIRAEKMPEKRFDLPNNERQRLVLYFSKNMVDWCFAGLVDKVRGLNESRHYASMDIDGDDLVIASRSGDERSESAHNGDLATFHRVKNFRDLVY